MFTNWRDWYNKANTKQPYIDQEKELVEIIHKYCPVINSVLDVGCGDGRLAKHFAKWQYWGIDKNYNEFELLKDEEWQSIDQKFDVCFTSLVLMLFNTNDAKYIFNQMKKRGKFVLLYEENKRNIEAPYTEDKFFHKYTSWDIKNLIKSGKSNVNPDWVWYLFKGEIA